MMFISCSNGVHSMFISCSYGVCIVYILSDYTVSQLRTLHFVEDDQSMTPSQTHSLRRHCWITSTTCNSGNNISRKCHL